MYTVYSIASIKRKYVYVGLTSDIEKRLNRHNQGYEKATKPYAPFILVYNELVESRTEAREREKFFKTRSGKRHIYRIITNDFPQRRYHHPTIYPLFILSKKEVTSFPSENFLNFATFSRHLLVEQAAPL